MAGRNSSAKTVCLVVTAIFWLICWLTVRANNVTRSRCPIMTTDCKVFKPEYLRMAAENRDIAAAALDDAGEPIAEAWTTVCRTLAQLTAVLVFLIGSSVLVSTHRPHCGVASSDCAVFKTAFDGMIRELGQHAQKLKTAGESATEEDTAATCRLGATSAICMDVYFERCVPHGTVFGSKSREEMLAFLHDKTTQITANCVADEAAETETQADE